VVSALMICFLTIGYVSHKFVRLFPLSPFDLPDESPAASTFTTEQEDDEIQSSPLLDFTSDNLITALITDIGVLTSSGVSEELIKMWYD
jgi:translation initiation factor eIF-2B subunit alpha